MRLLLSRDLAPIKEAAITEIDRRAGLSRMAYITVAPGQELVYMQKRQEAESYVSGGGSDTEFPHLQQESTLAGVTMMEYAVQILTLAHQWAVASSQIEVTRLGAKRAVELAQTEAEIAAILVENIQS